MCGIAGEIRLVGQKIDPMRLEAMARALKHRGPDGQGIWNEGRVGLVHRRLAIIDLSDGGKQPMQTPDGRFTITFNGEIYNYRDLKKSLEGTYYFRSGSDTEVLLALYALEGEKMLEKIRGMFAFAIWDRDAGKVFFARDRIGKKPFFYHAANDTFTFASELKALGAVEKLEMDPEAVKLFLGLQYVPSPLTGFKNIFSLEPGMCGTWNNGTVELKRYNSFEAKPTSTLSFDEAAQKTRELLDESVRLRLIADVPVGIFLSGGIDSSAVAALVHKQGAKLSSFTLGFDEAQFDERDQAASLAKQFGFDHHAFLAKPEDLLAAADDVIKLYDAPYADSSSLNTWFIAKETRQHVKAVLTGDGGDELFGGYNRYRHYDRAMWLNLLGMGGLAKFYANSRYALTRDVRYKRFAESLDGGYPALFCGAYFQQPEALAFVRSHLKEESILGAMDFDLRSYLPDDLNVKMDRATMAHGLEARSPLLDQELVSFVTALPAKHRFGSKKKALLVEAVKDLLPEEVGMRPKRGFQVPLATWFRGPLRSAFQERCLNSTKLHQFVERKDIEKLLKENDSGSDHGNRLWMLYSLATWLQTYG